MKIVQWIKTHRYCLAGLYLFVFLAGFFMLQNFGPEPRWIVYSVIDGWIPFNEWFVFMVFLGSLFYVLFYDSGEKGVSGTLSGNVCRGNDLFAYLSYLA